MPVKDPLWDEIEHVIVGGQRVALASRERLASAFVNDCETWRAAGRPHGPRLVFDANFHGLSLRASSPAYRSDMECADIVHADGGPIVTFSGLSGRKKIPERSSTTDMIHDFARAALENDLSFYLLGGTERVNAECERKLRHRYPGLRVAGRHHGYFSETEEDLLIEQINAQAPDIVWVGLGKPKEQAFCVRRRNQLKSAWLISCGGCFNYITGAYPRAPAWMQYANLEWLHRILSDPRRLFWRYATTNPHALWLCLTQTH